MCIVLLAIGIFCFITWFEQSKISTPHSVTRNLKKAKTDMAVASRLTANHQTAKSVKANGPSVPTAAKVALTEKRSKHNKASQEAAKASAKKIKFFPAEVAVGLEELFYSKAKVDSSIWKPNLGWPSIREIKWLANNTWGELAKGLCDYFKIGDCFKIIMAIFVHESSASPWAVNTSSGAVGGCQVVHKTARLLVAAKECQFPIEYLNRACPEQNLFLTIVLFKTNLAIAKSRGYKNYRDWAILYHYAGPGAAEDTAAAYGGLYNVPFVQSILGIENLKSKEAPNWAQNLWAKEDWATIENIRRLAGRRSPPKSVPSNLNIVQADADAD
jgi:hypothetical protein